MDLETHNCVHLDSNVDVVYGEDCATEDVCDLFENRDAIEGHVGCFKFHPKQIVSDLGGFLKLSRPRIRSDILRFMLEKHRAVKWYIAVVVKFVRALEACDDREQSITTVFHGLCRVTLTSKDTVNTKLDQSFARIIEQSNNFIHLGSGWIIDRIERHGS